MTHLASLRRIHRLKVTDNPAAALKLLDETILDEDTPMEIVELLRIARPGFVAEAKLAGPSEFALWWSRLTSRKAKEMR